MDGGSSGRCIEMDINLTGQLWGMPANLTGQIITNKPEQPSINLLDIVIIFFSIIFILYVIETRVIPIFGEFWYHQEIRPLSEHEGERFIFKKRNNIFIGYKPTHDRGFWKQFFMIFDDILSPLRKTMQLEEKMANWMFALSGGGLILIALNFDKFLIAKLEINFRNIPLYVVPDKILFLFIVLTLLISVSFHFSAKLGLYFLQSDLEDTLAYIPLSNGIVDLDNATQNIENLRRSLDSFAEGNIPAEYSPLVSRFESEEKNLDIKTANNWRIFQIGNAFFLVSFFSIIIYLFLFYFYY
jgi:hypothetical protein